MESFTHSEEHAPDEDEEVAVLRDDDERDDGDDDDDDLHSNNGNETDKEEMSTENETKCSERVLPKNAFDEHPLWVLGSWRRVPFELDSFPQALCAINDRKRKIGTVCLRDFDEEKGNLWKIIPAGDKEKEDGLFYLEVEGVGQGKSRRLSSTELILEEYAADKDAEFTWKFTKTDSFRGGRLDVAVVIENMSGLRLCSTEKTKSVLLLSHPAEWDLCDDSGNYLFNVAWECTPDTLDAISDTDDPVIKQFEDVLDLEI